MRRLFVVGEAMMRSDIYYIAYPLLLFCCKVWLVGGKVGGYDVYRYSK